MISDIKDEPTYSELALSAYDAGYFKGEQETNENYERKLWDEFAKAALVILAHPGCPDDPNPDRVADYCFDQADAMMAERKRRLENE